MRKFRTRLAGRENDLVRGYVIATTPRSGSNFLCELLASTDMLGTPQDWFNGLGIRQREDPHYPLERKAQLHAIIARGATPNGVYGVKMFCQRFDSLGDSNWADRLPNLRWIYLEREDLLGQAISDVRTSQTGQYRSTGGIRGPAFYDPTAIRKCLQRISVDHVRWRMYFARNGIRPLSLIYESISSTPQAAVDAVAKLMEIVPGPRIDPVKLALSVQRDDLSQEWRERFLKEAGGLSRLDRLWRSSDHRISRLWNRKWI